MRSEMAAAESGKVAPLREHVLPYLLFLMGKIAKVEDWGQES